MHTNLENGSLDVAKKFTSKSKPRHERDYTPEFKVEAVELALEIGAHKASKELEIPSGTIYVWKDKIERGVEP